MTFHNHVTYMLHMTHSLHDPRASLCLIVSYASRIDCNISNYLTEIWIFWLYLSHTSHISHNESWWVIWLTWVMLIQKFWGGAPPLIAFIDQGAAPLVKSALRDLNFCSRSEIFSFLDVLKQKWLGFVNFGKSVYYVFGLMSCQFCHISSCTSINRQQNTQN